MSWRTVVITKRAKLDYKSNYLVVRNEEEVRIHISEISILIIEDTSVSMTAYLLNELSKAKVKIIFCDEKRNPCAELVSYYGSHDTSLKLRRQAIWNDDYKMMVWTEIVQNKIKKQAGLLKKIGIDKHKLLFEYANEVEPGDKTNREGHAAKVYFNALFGLSFTRSEDCYINAALNYGYMILLSAFNREIVSLGYATQLGIFHENQYNPFNLSSDLMEPFRTQIDALVYTSSFEELNQSFKHELINVLNQKVWINEKQTTINYAIKIYTKSILEALSSGEISEIRFYRNEL